MVMKTEARVIEDALLHLHSHGHATMADKAYESLKALLSKVKEREWVSVKNRLPKFEGDYLTYRPAEGVWICTFYDGKWECESREEITDWMIMPNFPSPPQSDTIPEDKL